MREGAAVRLQSSEASCGPCAVSNACKALRLGVSESDVSKWLNRVKRRENPGAEGVAEGLLLRAITEGAPKALRLRARAMQVHDRGVALAALRGDLEAGRTVILAVDEDSHWVAAVGRLGDTYLVADGGDPTAEVVLAYSEDQLAARWEVAGNPPGFFGLVLWRG